MPFCSRHTLPGPHRPFVATAAECAAARLVPKMEKRLYTRYCAASGALRSGWVQAGRWAAACAGVTQQYAYRDEGHKALCPSSHGRVVFCGQSKGSCICCRTTKSTVAACVASPYSPTYFFVAALVCSPGGLTSGVLHQFPKHSGGFCKQLKDRSYRTSGFAEDLSSCPNDQTL